MNLPPDFADLLTEFARFGVEYLVVGGYAVAFHATPRATKDLDLWVGGSPANLEKVARALEAFGAPAGTVRDARKLGSTEVLFFGLPPLRIDVLRSIDGVEFSTAYGTRSAARIGDLEVSVIGLEDLIRNKRASGRPQDLVDALALEQVASSRA
jgi:hypothetical protein